MSNSRPNLKNPLATVPKQIRDKFEFVLFSFFQTVGHSPAVFLLAALFAQVNRKFLV